MIIIIFIITRFTITIILFIDNYDIFNINVINILLNT